jgi:hypothetical protein
MAFKPRRVFARITFRHNRCSTFQPDSKIPVERWGIDSISLIGPDPAAVRARPDLHIEAD